MGFLNYSLSLFFSCSLLCADSKWSLVYLADFFKFSLVTYCVWQILGRVGGTETIYRQNPKPRSSDHWTLLSLNVLWLPCHKRLFIGHFLQHVPSCGSAPLPSPQPVAAWPRELREMGLWECRRHPIACEHEGNPQLADQLTCLNSPLWHRWFSAASLPSPIL